MLRHVSILRILLSCVFLTLALHARAQDLVVIPSDNLHCTDSILVFSPRGKALERNLPTLFLLHGYNGKYSSWSENTDLQALCDEGGWRIICPDGFADSWYLDNADPSKMQWRSFFWKECWPVLEHRYGFVPDKTFIDGLSMGGHGAMNLFLDHPERFRGAGSMSGILVLRHSGGSRTLIPKILGVDSIDDPVCEAQSAINRLDRVGEGKLLVISCGTEDKFIPASDEFAARCRELGLPHVAIFSPGQHRWSYWTWALPYHLQLFSETL